MTKTYIALDFKTTGLHADSCSIIEIRAVKFTADGEIVDTFTSFADPGVKISPSSIKVHGITDDLVQGASSAIEVWNQLLEWADDTSVFVVNEKRIRIRLCILRNFLEKSASINFSTLDTTSQ